MDVRRGRYSRAVLFFFSLAFLFTFVIVIGSISWAVESGTSPVDDEAVSKLRQMTPEEIAALDARLEEALTLYYDNQFGRALPIFNEIADRVQTMDLLWWVGTSAMKTGDITLAIAKFKAMLAADPSLHRVRLDLAWAYFQLERYDDARAELETVSAASPPQAVRDNIAKLMRAIDERTKHTFWNVRIAQGYMYDTNASAGPNERDLAVQGGTLTLGDDTKKVRDDALVTSAQGNVLYDFGRRQGFAWNTEAVFYNSAYQTYSKYNFMMVDVNTGPWWVGRQDVLKIPVGYTEQYYESERLSHIMHIDPSYEHYFGQYFSLRGSYSYQKEFFYNENNSSLEHNTRVYELSPSVYLFNRRHILSAMAGFENRNADGRRYSYDGWYWGLTYMASFPTDTELFVRYKRMERDYKEKPLLYTNDRKDKRDVITVVVSQTFLKYFFASLAFNYTDNDSNAALYEFDKATYTVTVGCTF
jgi:tetratricopeptide (TPR) repeat protein